MRKYFALLTLVTLWVAGVANATICDPERIKYLSRVERALCATYEFAPDTEITLADLAERIRQETGVYVRLDTASLTATGMGSDTLLFPRLPKMPWYWLLEKLLGDYPIRFRATQNALVFYYDAQPKFPAIYRYDPQILSAEKLPGLLKTLTAERSIDDFTYSVASEPAVFGVQAPWEMHWLLKSEAGIHPVLPRAVAYDALDVPVLEQRVRFEVRALDRTPAQVLAKLSQGLEKLGYAPLRWTVDISRLTANGHSSDLMLNLHIPAVPPENALTLGEVFEFLFGPYGLVVVEQQGILNLTTPEGRDALRERRDFSAPPQVPAPILFDIFRATVFPESWEPRPDERMARTAEMEALQAKLRERVQELGDMLGKAEEEIPPPDALDDELKRFYAEFHRVQLQGLGQLTAALGKESEFDFLNMGDGKLQQKRADGPQFTVVNAPHVVNCVEYLLRSKWEE